jgi:hypothetical protein
MENNISLNVDIKYHTTQTQKNINQAKYALGHLENNMIGAFVPKIVMDMWI